MILNAESDLKVVLQRANLGKLKALVVHPQKRTRRRVSYLRKRLKSQTDNSLAPPLAQCKGRSQKEEDHNKRKNNHHHQYQRRKIREGEIKSLLVVNQLRKPNQIKRLHQVVMRSKSTRKSQTRRKK